MTLNSVLFKGCALPTASLCSCLAVAVLILFSFGAGPLPVPSAWAEQPAPALSTEARQKLNVAREFLDQSRWTEARRHLEEIVEVHSAEPQAMALAWQMLAYLHGREDRRLQALAAYEQAVGTGLLDAETNRQILFNTAQLLAMSDRHDEAARRIRSWLAQTPRPTSGEQAQAGWILLTAGQAGQAADLLQAAIQSSTKPDQRWTELMLAALHQSGRHEELSRHLRQAIEQSSRDQRLWRHLAATHLQLKQNRQAVAVLSCAVEKGLFTSADDILQVVQLYRQAGAPRLGARLLERGLKEGRVAPSQAHHEILVDCWLQARQPRQAATVLEQMLATGDNCRLRVRLGRMLVQTRAWNEARTHLQAAVRGNCQDLEPEAHLLLGMANYHLGQLEEARTAFLQARSTPQLQKQAEAWARLTEQRRRIQG